MDDHKTTRRRLLRGHKHYLVSRNGDSRRFVKMFLGTWKQIPLSDRRKILAYWREIPPSFELSDSWPPEDAYGQVDSGLLSDGRIVQSTIRFRAFAFRHFPTDAAAWIIAHELAHVVQKANGRRPCGDSDSENEDDADRIAEEWGFSRTFLVFIQRLQDNAGKTFQEACNSFRTDDAD